MNLRTSGLAVLVFALAAACGGSEEPAEEGFVRVSGRSGNSGGGSSGGGSGSSGSSSSGKSTTKVDVETIEVVTEAPADTPVAKHGQLRVKDQQILDANGQPVQLRGISSMWLNWEQTGYATNLEGLRWLRDNWKMSLFRAAMPIDTNNKLMTEEVRAGLKAKLETIIRYASQLGIYVLVDLHSHAAHTYEDVAVELFDDLSKKYGGLPNVIYEPYNEPLKVSWTDILKPYHEKIISTIRANDPDNIIVLGTPNWSQSVDEAAADPVKGDNIAYTLHFYSCTHGEWLMDRGDTAWGRKVALFVTEWGATDADGGVKNKKVCATEGGSDTQGVGADTWHKWMNQSKISWAAWKFDDCADTSCLFKAGAPVNGGWTDEWLQGHGSYVRDKMLAP